MTLPQLHLAVVSYPSRLERVFEETVLHLGRSVGPDFALERCQDPDDVVYLARLWKNRGKAIVRLDLYGHGDGGRFKLGDRLLFASDGTGYPLARRLGPKLAGDAEVRLLGCDTAGASFLTRLSGKTLLADLQRILGRRRRVLGTLGPLGPRDLGPRGPSAAAEARLRGARRPPLVRL